MTVSQNAQYQHSETEAAKWLSDIIININRKRLIKPQFGLNYSLTSNGLLYQYMLVKQMK